MKKIFLFIGFLTISFFTANAQEISNNAIGLRLGDNDGFGAEITYQRRLSDANRLEIDLGLRNGSNYDGFKATGLYQWVWQLENRFNWYAGAGGGLGHWNVKNVDASETYIFAAGVVGIEYNFDIPLMLSLDYRPEIGFGDYYDGFNSDFGLSIRYQF
ncbi:MULTISPECIES: hypothetical protein [Tenacibaculum]|uniref:Outer membrane protein beta-barrel domain-containing protein n=1 Tax=Tenacibaculum sp. Pbs-1 TaxID=3238748 RepID=A0AB33KTV1_9FLAO|nr:MULTISPECIES: hypothetical protein [Tenacibaculum]GFD75293.1 hypothetical protein KUL113_47130 [Tenacibaculum sp. KUL113]GFD80341.1 hypothetical protein KUL118_32030 [Tenacibaculum sp. KUL118]KAF9660047.1 hypothetical protein HBA12_07370 [Tenacibaculum mesophilum]MCG7501696.1 hypothetical protein [Tenacibaculum sp. Mcav3-52]MCO7184984.1 hypothetical protein [Tenacibaculum sp. XPcli2-G]